MSNQIICIITSHLTDVIVLSEANKARWIREELPQRSIRFSQGCLDNWPINFISHKKKIPGPIDHVATVQFHISAHSFNFDNFSSVNKQLSS